MGLRIGFWACLPQAGLTVTSIFAPPPPPSPIEGGGDRRERRDHEKNYYRIDRFNLSDMGFGWCCPEGLRNSREKIILPEAALYSNITY